MRKITYWSCLALLIPALGWGVHLFGSVGLAKDSLLDGLPTLRSESMGSDGHGNTVLWRIYSTVELVDEDESGSRALPLFVSYAEPKGERTKGQYRYRYVFKNDGTSKIKINLSEWDVVQSPLTEVLQDFALELEAQESVTVEFLTDETIAPQNVLSPVNIAVWNSAENRWSVTGAGQASLYTPSALGLLKAPPGD